MAPRKRGAKRKSNANQRTGKKRNNKSSKTPTRRSERIRNRVPRKASPPRIPDTPDSDGADAGNILAETSEPKQNSPPPPPRRTQTSRSTTTRDARRKAQFDILISTFSPLSEIGTLEKTKWDDVFQARRQMGGAVQALLRVTSPQTLAFLQIEGAKRIMRRSAWEFWMEEIQLYSTSDAFYQFYRRSMETSLFLQTVRQFYPTDVAPGDLVRIQGVDYLVHAPILQQKQFYQDETRYTPIVAARDNDGGMDTVLVLLDFFLRNNLDYVGGSGSKRLDRAHIDWYWKLPLTTVTFGAGVPSRSSLLAHPDPESPGDSTSATLGEDEVEEGEFVEEAVKGENVRRDEVVAEPMADVLEDTPPLAVKQELKPKTLSEQIGGKPFEYKHVGSKPCVRCVRVSARI